MFCYGLRTKLLIKTHSLVTISHSFLVIVDHTCVFEQFCCEDLGETTREIIVIIATISFTRNLRIIMTDHNSRVNYNRLH